MCVLHVCSVFILVGVICTCSNVCIVDIVCFEDTYLKISFTILHREGDYCQVQHYPGCQTLG